MGRATQAAAAGKLCRAGSERLESRVLLNAGDPDLAFSGDGRATISFPGTPLTIFDTAVTPAGKVIVAGRKGGNMAIARLNADGSLDTTFGNGGLFESDRATIVTSLAVQGDGKIVVGLGSTGDFSVDLIVGRVLANGASFDGTFGDVGIANVGDRWETSSVNDVVVQRDGKIIAAGSRLTGVLVDSDFALARYDANGAPDPTFDGDGVAVASFGGIADGIRAVTVDYNGNSATNPYYGTVVAVGGNGPLRPERFQILRLRPDGSPDSGFDGDGKLTSPDLSSAGIEAATDVVVQPGGKIVVAGTARSSLDANQANFLIARYTNTGALDPTFGLAGGGKTELDLGGRDDVGALAIGYLGTANNVSGANNVLISGSRDGQFAVIALRDDGQVDTRFSGDGILTTTIPGHATGLFATGDLYPPVRKFVMAGGDGQVARYVDVGSLISIGTFQPQMYEQGSLGTSFLVTRTQALPYAETILLTTSGTATILGASRDFNATGILFGNGTTTSTQVTIPAGQTTATVTLTPIDDALNEGDETITFTVGTTLTYDASATKSTTLIIRDNDTVGGPVVIDSGFNYETAPINATITFDRSVVTSFTVGDLVITGPSGPAPVYSLDYNNVTNTGTMVFYNGLADGNYSVKVKGSGVTSGGIPMAADYVFSFYVLAGDANRDRLVDFDDLVILAQNYNKTGKTFTQGNFNYSADGKVDFDDLVILAQRYNKPMLLPAASVAAAKQASSAVPRVATGRSAAVKRVDPLA